MADGYCTRVTIAFLNLSDENVAVEYTYSRAAIILTTVINPLLFSLGIIGNFCFVFTIARVRYMWTVLNIYLANLSLSAVLILVSGLSNTLVRYRGSPVPLDFLPLGSIGCVSVNIVYDIAIWAALVFGAMVILVLYRAVLRPFRFRRLGDRKTAIALSSGMWLCCCCVGAVFSPTWSSLDRRCVAWPDTEQYSVYPESIGVCSPAEDWILILHDLIQSICFFACGINGFLVFATIIRKLKRVSPSHPKGNQQPIPRGRQRHDQVIQMVIISSAVFFTFPIPYNCTLFSRSIAKLANNFVLDELQYNNLMLVSTTLMNVAPSVCPYTYALTNARYRGALMAAFTQGCVKRNHHFVIRADRTSTMHIQQK